MKDDANDHIRASRLENALRALQTAITEVQEALAEARAESGSLSTDNYQLNRGSTPKSVSLSPWKSNLSKKRILFGLSVVCLLICAGGATAHYLLWSWGNRAHPIGWLLSIVFLLLAFAPPPREGASWLKSLIRPTTA